MRLFIVFLVCVLISTKSYSNTKDSWLINTELSFGNSYFEGTAASFGANLKLDIVPIIRLGERSLLLPRYSGIYSGTRLATEITDYGNLYQQIQDHTIAGKLIMGVGEKGKLKIEPGIKKEYSRETRDEEWGKGLYDYDSVFCQVDLENQYENSSTIGCFSRYYTLKFPNYQSLSSEQGTEIMGDRVFDNNTLQIGVNGTLFFRNKKDFFRGSCYIAGSNYTDQKIVASDGSYSSEKRGDTVLNFDTRVVFNPEKVKNIDYHIGLKLGVRRKTSNQNHYDPDFYQFIPKFYDYSQLDLGPYFIFKLEPSDATLMLGYIYSSKNYNERPAQDAGGNYLTEKMYWGVSTISLQVNYPVKKVRGMQFFLGANYCKYQSNMLYEKYYKYNFTTLNFLLGATYEY